MTVAFLGKRLQPARFADLADGLAVGVAVSLPWSVSVTSIFLVLWLLALVPTLDFAALRRALALPAGGLPVAFVVLGALGMLWADSPFSERLGGFDSFIRFLVIPLLLAQFRRSEHGMWVLKGFLASCVALLLLSTACVLWPPLGAGWGKSPGVPIKDYISQSGEFVVCAFALAPLLVEAVRARKWSTAVALSLLVLALLANVFYVATGRTTLVVIVVLLVIFCLRQFTWKAALAALSLALVVAAAVWLSSPYLRMRVVDAYHEVEHYRTENLSTPAGQRLEYWKKSLGFVAEAPIIGHGTGSILEMFRRAAIGQTGVAGELSGNPHNQTFAVAIQLGLVGIVVLYAMWMAHLLLFRGQGFLAWVGLVVVVENIVGSLFNSFLFDFTQGWIYVFGVGVAGGMVLRSRAAELGHSAAD
jgi:O-antigen ligase